MPGQRQQDRTVTLEALSKTSESSLAMSGIKRLRKVGKNYMLGVACHA